MGLSLVVRGCGVGARALLRRIRSAGARRYGGDGRGRARSSWTSPVLVDLREARRDRLLYRAHGAPRVHEMGNGAAGTSRSLQAAAARVSRRDRKSVV